MEHESKRSRHVTLFEFESSLPELEPEPDSYQRRLTRRNKATLAAGRNPATGLPLADNGETCESCRNLTYSVGSQKIYYKCGLMPKTAGAATDIRLSWPACEKWETKRR